MLADRNFASTARIKRKLPAVETRQIHETHRVGGREANLVPNAN